MEGTLQQIVLSDLGDTVGTPPSSSLVSSVRRNGVVQPIVLAEIPDQTGETRLKLIDGNRRVRAARLNGLSSIPAIVLRGVDADAISQLTLMLNGFRTANYLTEYWAIKQLQKQGVRHDEIQSISGLSRAKVSDRTNLSSLDRELFVALRNGEIFQTHAVAISKLPSHDQAQLLTTFRRNGRLQLADIDRFKPPRKPKKEAPAVSESITNPVWSAQSPPSAIGTSIASPEGYPAVNHRAPKPVHMEPNYQSGSPTNTSAGVASRTRQSDNSSMIPRPSQPSDRTPALPVNNVYPESVGGFAHIEADATREALLPSTASRAVVHMRSAVIATQLLDFDKAEFLEMAARIWDETLNQQSEQQLMRDQTPTEPFPDLAAHKWDTGES